MLVDPLALSKQHPELSASVPLTGAQKLMIVLVCVAVTGLAIWKPWPTACVFVMLSTVFYLLFTAYKFLLVRFSVVADSEIVLEASDLAAVSDDELPVYSVLVPMYHEPETVAQMVASLQAMDYPKGKLDVQLLLEEDDTATRAAAEQVDMPPGFQVTVAPKSFPRTKPKACNIGLAKAIGKYLVVYDAEDRPEPDQIKKAAIAFMRSPADVVCLQSRLNFYNPRQNLLTRWFAAEYSAWFDLNLPGLSALGAVIPLGGTSNHFVTETLREELLGWDAYNVTEDCDLGIRIYRAGYRSLMLRTTTWEEACCDLGFWVRQRTRWLKGYIQTYMVHMRNPFGLIRDLGLENFLHFQLLIGGIVVSFLINPIFWLLALVWFCTRLEVLTSLFPLPVFAIGAFCLFVGNFAFVYIGAIACYRRGYYDLLKYALLAPLHWMLMSYSGWRAFFQFFANPFYWEKTQHGMFTANTQAGASQTPPKGKT